MPLIPALGRQELVDLNEFGASLVFRASFGTSKAIRRNSISKERKKGRKKGRKKKRNKKRKRKLEHA